MSLQQEHDRQVLRKMEATDQQNLEAHKQAQQQRVKDRFTRYWQIEANLRGEDLSQVDRDRKANEMLNQELPMLPDLQAPTDLQNGQKFLNTAFGTVLDGSDKSPQFLPSTPLGKNEPPPDESVRKMVESFKGSIKYGALDRQKATDAVNATRGEQ
jgi:hypothetical protein